MYAGVSAGPAAAVMRVLQADEPAVGMMRVVGRPDSRFDVGEVKRAVGLVGHRPGVDAAYGSSTARLEKEKCGPCGP